MIELDEFNKQRLKQVAIHDSDAPLLNGIKCPECGSELLDSKPRGLLLSSPPQKNINCNECGYSGYRMA